jgi:hypothetical protein
MNTCFINDKSNEYSDYKRFYDNGGNHIFGCVREKESKLELFLVFLAHEDFMLVDEQYSIKSYGSVGDYLVIVKNAPSFICHPQHFEHECAQRGLIIKVEDVVVNFGLCTKKIKKVTNGICISMGTRDGSGCSCYLSLGLDICEPYKQYLELKHHNERLLEESSAIEDGRDSG